MFYMIFIEQTDSKYKLHLSDEAMMYEISWLYSFRLLYSIKYISDFEFIFQ